MFSGRRALDATSDSAAPEVYRALERRGAAAPEGWRIVTVPPLGRLSTIRFAGNIDTLDQAAREAVLLSAWEAHRWNTPSLAVPGLRGEGMQPFALRSAGAGAPPSRRFCARRASLPYRRRRSGRSPLVRWA